MKKKKIRHPKLGSEFALISKRNRVFKNKKKELEKTLCKQKVSLTEW